MASCQDFVVLSDPTTHFLLDPAVSAMSLPFRFREEGSGGSKAPISMAHHHRSTTKISHKPFKPRFASKGSLRDQSKGTFRAPRLAQRSEINISIQARLKSTGSTAADGEHPINKSCPKLPAETKLASKEYITTRKERQSQSFSEESMALQDTSH